MAYNPTNPNGQATAANSAPVVLASDQSPVPFSAASLPLPTGAGTEATLAGVRTDLGTDGTTPPAVLGAGTGVRGWLRSIYEKLTGSIAVTGTFFQATQPVSAASLPLPTGAGTEATLAGVRTDLGTDGTTPPAVLGAGTGVRGWLRSIYEKLTGSIAVTGTFFQATQPVSIAVNTPTLAAGTAVFGALVANQSVNSAQINGVAPLMGNGVTGTGSQRVTIASDNTAFPVNATLAAETTKVIGTVNQAALTKGTQGATGVTTQDLKDAGRVMVNYTATALAGVTAETLISFTPYRDLVAGTAATTFAVTAGKRLRLQTLTLTLRSTSTVNVGAIARFRMLAGAVLVTSPVHNSVSCMSSNLATAVIGNAMSYQLTFPDGFELSGTMQFGLTQLASATSAALDIHVTGFEY